MTVLRRNLHLLQRRGRSRAPLTEMFPLRGPVFGRNRLTSPLARIT